MSDVVAFWAVALLIGAAGLPVGFLLLRRLPDAGAGLSFALGLVLTGYAYFILRSLDVLPPGRGGYLLAPGVVVLVSVMAAGRDRRFASTLSRSWPAIVAVAGLFTVMFFSFVAFRSYVPDVTGTEQPMDFMYLNATVASEEYPPQDPWLAGEPASYYYFGYLQIGVLGEIASVPTSTGYNLGLAYTFAASATGITSVAFALSRWALGTRGRRWAVVGASSALVFLLALGSLSALFEVAAAHGNYNQGLYEALGIEWMIPCESGQSENCFSGAVSPRTTSWYPTEYWFWWRGTRIIPNTITEFPFFSFLLGDMHPHVMSIPLVLLAVGLAAGAWRGRSLLSHRTLMREPLQAVVLAVVLGALAFQNAWDLLTFAGLFAVAVLVRNLGRAPPVGAIVAAAGYFVPILAVGIAIYLPWYLDFDSQASGLQPYLGAGTRPAHAFLQFGTLLAAAALGLILAFRRGDGGRTVNAALGTVWIVIVPVLGWMLFASLKGDLQEAVDARGSGGWVTMFAYAIATWALATAFAVLAWRRSAAAFPLGIAALGALLLLGCELFYIKDIFSGFIPRQNTVFKLAYQAWILLALAGAATLAVTLRQAAQRGLLPLVAVTPVLLLVAGALVYPVTATPNRANAFDGETAIDGLEFLARSDPDEYALTAWVRNSVDPSEVIIEGSGRTFGKDQAGQVIVRSANSDYTDAGRISARTGRMTLLGWFGHELQWRGPSDENNVEFARRQNLMDAPYIAASPGEAVAAMRQANARYLVVGQLERRSYSGLMPNFEEFLDVAFEAGEYRVYELPRYSVLATS